jgi:HAD superfamily hydrolase (TIGR01509 family)
MKFSAVIFDMDGLMLDSERIYRQIFNRAAADCDFEFPASLHETLLGRTVVDMKRIVRGILKNDDLFDRFMDRNHHYHDVCFAEAPPIKRGLHELLDFLEARKIPKVVATSTPRNAALGRLAKCGLLNRFASISCGDEVVHGKPAPDLFLLAASRIPAQPTQCVVLEDSEAGVTGAHAAGMTVCMVPDLKQPTDDIRQRAQGVYESLVHVREMFEGIA